MSRGQSVTISQDLSLRCSLSAGSTINTGVEQFTWLMPMCGCQAAWLCGRIIEIKSSIWPGHISPDTDTQLKMTDVWVCVSVCDTAEISAYVIISTGRTPEDDGMMIHKLTHSLFVSLQQTHKHTQIQLYCCLNVLFYLHSFSMTCKDTQLIHRREVFLKAVTLVNREENSFFPCTYLKETARQATKYECLVSNWEFDEQKSNIGFICKHFVQGVVLHLGHV